jgi:cell wall-associated NlpC family hydrolase
MPMIRLLLLLILVVAPVPAVAADVLFAVAVTPAPVLNRPDFRTVFGGEDGRTLLQDECGQLRALEFVALPGTVFTVEGEIAGSSGTVYRVTTSDYPYPSTNGYFVDARSVRLEKQRPPERARKLPAKEKLLATMESRVGTRYVWGGNVAAGVAELSGWYPPTGTVDRSLWQLAGVDCSGLLYEASNGYTPRNTSALLGFGKPVEVAGKSVREISARLQPLDLIVWPGHVMIVLDRGRVIESRLVCQRPAEGVRIRLVGEALTEIMKKRKPVNGIA